MNNFVIKNAWFMLGVSVSSCPEVQMGFCMEATGMTEGGQGELHMERGSMEEPAIKDETESMEDEQDSEVTDSFDLSADDRVVTEAILLSLSVFWSFQFGPMTVEIKSQKKNDLSANSAGPKAPDLKDILNVDPLQQGQALMAARKKMKKQQKRAGLYTFLVSVLHCTSCMICLRCFSSFLC